MVKRRPKAAHNDGGRGRMRSLPLLPLCLGAVVGGVGGVGCDLDDVTVNLGDPIVIVHAIMRPDQPQQYVIVERSFTGDSLGFSDGDPIPRDIPQRPIDGATVTVRNLDHPADPCGAAVVFDQRPVDPTFFPLPGIYWGPAGCPTMRPGDRLELRVETPSDEVVTGRTLVPGLTSATLTTGDVSRPFGSDTVVFNRDHDTLGIALEAASFRAMQVEVRRRRGAFEPGASALDVSLLTFVDSSAVRIAGDIKDLFDRGEGGDSFIPGRNVSLTVGVADTNYFDFQRTRTNEFTGRGLLNHLDGGIGVFGSVIPVVHPIRVVADQEDPREGEYRLSGTIEGIDVDLRLDVYVPRSVDSTGFAAFANGTWAQVGPFGPEGSAAWAELQVRDASVDGLFSGDGRIEARFPCPGECFIGRYVLRGIWDATSFGIAVFDSSGISSTRIGLVSATKQ